MGKVHILNQFLWPDAAPTGIYAEQLADRLGREGAEVILVGGNGSYRRTTRPQPTTKIINLPHYCGRRSSLLSTLVEYESVGRAYEAYIRKEVRKGDLVVATSAPPTTLRLSKTIRRQGATGIYWLQDFYPELVRGIYEYPALLRRMVSKWWMARLDDWDHVVKAAGNLPGEGPKYRTIRNWPTLSFPKTAATTTENVALYTGNLGYCHDLHALIEECRKLHESGCRVEIRADGVQAKKLPSWIHVAAPFSSEQELLQAQMAARVHLVAAHPRIQGALFPSKIWNSLAAGKKIVASGFAGKMAEELDQVFASPYEEHLNHYVSFLDDCSRAAVG
ncbi:MAG: hypothetical protein QM796_22985 [Chthoniobacteraceae bacterium]